MSGDGLDASAGLMELPYADGGSFGAPIVLSGGVQPWALTIDGTGLYWSDAYGNAVMRSDLDGGSTVVLTHSANPSPIAVDDHNVYWADTCANCPLKRDCTTGKERRVRRWEKEDVLERAQARLDGFPGAMRQRRETAEHPFGTLKAWMGATHFKMKTLKHVATEMALHVLAYNIKRVIAILGAPKLIEAICAFISLLAAAIWRGWACWRAQRPSPAAYA